MQISRRAFLDDFLAYVNEPGDAIARDMAERMLIRVVEAIWLKRSWRQFLMPDAYEFSTVAGTRAYALPDYFGRVSSLNRTLRNLTTGIALAPIDRSDLEAQDPNQGTSLETPGTPGIYLIAGTAGVHNQPAAAGESLEVLSSSAADVAVRVYIEGLNTAGQWTRNQVTLNGTTPVDLGSWKTIQAFGKAYPEGTTATTELTSSEGSVTLRTTAAATELQLLLAEESAREVQTLTVYPVPDGVYRIAVPILRIPEALTKDAAPLPSLWTNAVFEKMVISWRAGAKDGLTIDTADVWPALIDLVCHENAQQAQELRHRKPHVRY